MKRHIWVCMIFLILTVALTYPLAFRLTTHMPGFFSSDENFAPLWDSWRIKFSFQHKLSFRTTDFIAYPFGVDLYSSGYLSYLWLGIIYFLSIFTSPAFTYNIQVLCNFFLSGIFTYLLVFHLTKNSLSAVLSGIIFAFCPYQFARAWQHLGLTFNQWIPLLLLSAILLRQRNSAKRSFLFLFSLLLLLSFDWSVMYLSAIMILAFFIYILFYDLRARLFKQREVLKADLAYLKRIIFLGLIIFVLFLPQFFSALKNRIVFAPNVSSSAFSIYRRPFENLFSQSARPLSYFLPAVVHPIFGAFTENFIGTDLYGDSLTEHTLYLGWTGLILAFAAYRSHRRKRRLGGKNLQPAAKECEDFYIGLFVFLGITAWLFSQPPWWKFGPLKIFMPSFLMYKILPLFRAYCRFGIVVMLSIAALAGFGLKHILEGFKTQKSRIIITALFCILALFEFWNWPPYKVIDVSGAPDAYHWLKSQPGQFVIAEYPLDADSPNELFKFYQAKHEKKIINGTLPGTLANKAAQAIIRLSSPRTAGLLKRMGVKYVFVHKKDYLKTDLLDDAKELEQIPQNPGLKLIQSFPAEDCPQAGLMCIEQTGPIDVYELLSGPVNPRTQE